MPAITGSFCQSRTSLKGQCASVCWQHWALLAMTLHFFAPDLWPPNSPDLNPVDYKVWDVMQECVYHMPILDIADLKRHLKGSAATCHGEAIALII